MKPKPLILYVEDEALIAIPGEDVLTDAGFEVEHVDNGQSAMAALDARADKYVALITDVRLPKVDGWTIARRARTLNPGLPVVYVTGDSATDWDDHGVPESVLVQKPYANAELVAALVTLIEAASKKKGVAW
jgi:DNA-binding response OmpR family regulator